jgi:hypothetical protein
MKCTRALGFVVLALLLAVGLTACGKKSETDVSSTTPEVNPATVAETPASGTTAGTESAPAEPAPPAAAPAAPKATAPAKPKTSATPAVAEKSKTVSAPVGTAFDVTLVTPVRTDSSSVGDRIEAILVAPMIVDNRVIANQGAVLHGEITELTRASKDKSEEARASVKLAFTSIETVDGEKSLDATVTNVEALQAGGTGKRDALVIGGAAAAGAILGRLIGKDTKGAVVGAVAGAAVGTGGVLLAKGHDLDLPAGSKISLKAEQPITIVSK